jgi:hypothetical protein
MKTHKLVITMDQVAAARREDPKTYAIPQFYKEATGFDKPTTYRLTVKQNQRFLENLFLSNCPR